MNYVFFTFVGLLGCASLAISLYYFGGMKAIWFVLYFLLGVAGLTLIVGAFGIIVDLIRGKEERHGQRHGG